VRTISLVLCTSTNITFTYIERILHVMRPEIPSELEALIEEVYKDYGFSSKSEFVRHATREYAIELRDSE